MESKQELFEKNMNFAYWFIGKYFPALVGDEDISQIALIGLWKACDMYDETRGKFATLAGVCIRNEILMELRKQNKISDLYRVYLSDPIKEGENLAIEDAVKDESYRPDGSSIFVTDLIKSLSPREKQVISCRLNGLTQQQAAKQMGISQAYYSRVLKAVRKKLG